MFGGNDCNVDERPWSSVVESCNCNTFESSDCQLRFMNNFVTCKYNVNSSCVSAVENWANAYSSASNSNDPACKDHDPNYKVSQKAWGSCSYFQGT